MRGKTNITSDHQAAAVPHGHDDGAANESADEFSCRADHAWLDLRRPLRALIAMALAAPIAVGCAGKATETTQVVGEPEAPRVISGQPNRDGVALRAADGHLSTVRWGVLDELGPRPAWEQVGLGGKNRPDTLTDVDPADLPPEPVGGRATPADTDFPAPTTAPVMDTTGLPVQITTLPDGRLRMVWTLRSYGGSRVTSKMDGGTSRRNVALEPADLAPLAAAITPYLGDGGTLVPLPRENTLVINCRPEARDTLIDLLRRLDAPARQVEITAKVFEVTNDFDLQTGTELLLQHVSSEGVQTALSRFNSQSAIDAGGTDAPFQGSVISLMHVFQDAGLSLDASFQLLAEAGLIRVVSSPRMTVAVGQTGYMLAGQEIPIQSSEIVGNNIRTSTTYKPVGVQLYITPQSAGDAWVKLHTISVVSSVAGFSPVPTLSGKGVPLINPIINTREAETAVTVGDGSTLVISGLRMVKTVTREDKIPGLGDIPLLGWLFKNHRSQQQLTDLYFFLTPQLL